MSILQICEENEKHDYINVFRKKYSTQTRAEHFCDIIKWWVRGAFQIVSPLEYAFFNIRWSALKICGSRILCSQLSLCSRIFFFFCSGTWLQLYISITGGPKVRLSVLSMDSWHPTRKWLGLFPLMRCVHVCYSVQF